MRAFALGRDYTTILTIDPGLGIRSTGASSVVGAMREAEPAWVCGREVGAAMFWARPRAAWKKALCASALA